MTLEYFLSSHKPTVLISCGTHGDEYESITSITNFLKTNSNHLPGFLYVPFTSPSAIAKKTRNNNLNHDLNRHFFNHSKDPEIIENINLLKKYHFKLCLSFHEDPTINEFYLYDSGTVKPTIRKQFYDKLTKNRIKLYHGIDDPDDPDLGFKINHGYSSFKNIPPNPKTGTFWDWGLSNNIFDHILLFEIPGKIPITKKESIVQIIFENLIIPITNSLPK